MNLLITICARGGSKGIPGKNIKLMNNKPLIYYTVEFAINFKEQQHCRCDLFLSSDSQEIIQIVRRLNFSQLDTSYTRPAFLATDQAGKLAVIQNIMNYAQIKNNIQYDYVLDLDVTSPLRSVDDIRNAFSILEKNDEALNILSVSPANRNPYFNMVEKQGDGFYGLCKAGHFLTRQSAPKVYDLNASFYIYRKKFFAENHVTAITGKTLVYVIPHICFDLDHPLDFEFLEYLMKTDKIDFDFLT